MHLHIFALMGALLLGMTNVRADTGVYYFHHENVLGTSLELRISAESESGANRAEARALAEIDRLNKILSSYNPKSEFSTWQKTSHLPVQISPDLFEVLHHFDQWRAQTFGALDASAEAVCRLWKTAAVRQQIPTQSEIDAVLQLVRRPHWTLDARARTATHLDDTPLILNSFAKSYIASRACDEALRNHEVNGAVVNIGGDLVIRGVMVENVSVTDPKADAENSDPISRIHLHDRAVATSGGYRRGVEIGGRWYSHIVDPRIGLPVDHVLSATVVAPNAVDAGALATAFCVLTPTESLEMLASVDHAECLLITRDGGRISSKGWNAMEIPPLRVAAVGDPPGLLAAAAEVKKTSALDPAFELLVHFELARIEDQRAKRPYLAIWLEDTNKVSVRTLALWMQKPKYLPDLRVWTHADQQRTQAGGKEIVDSVSSATRSPGKYSVKWDGRDDKGEPLNAGKYTIIIEAAREHGTHQIIRQDLDFDGTPQKVELKGNVEISTASLDYHRKPVAP